MNSKLTVDERLARLEGTVFGNQRRSVSRKSPPERKGPTGGIKDLIRKGAFKKKCDLGEVRGKLAKNDYHYSAQAVDMALKRLSTIKGPLVALKEKGQKYYVERK
jgi:hypothetical protein